MRTWIFRRSTITVIAMPTAKKCDCIELTKKEVAAYDAFLKEKGVIHAGYVPPIFPGCIAVSGDILEKAAQTAMAFQRACEAAFERMQKDAALREAMLRPFSGYPALEESVLSEQFFMEFFRIDFYLNPVTDELHIIEANSSPGGFVEHWLMDKFLAGFLDCTPPKGFAKAEPAGVLHAFIKFWERTRSKPLRTLGLVAEDDGSLASLGEAKWFADRCTDLGITPVLCKIEGGHTLSLIPDEKHPISNIRELDALYHNPGGSFEIRNTFTKEMKNSEIVFLPPRSNLLFTNKAFLGTLLENLDDLDGLTKKDRALLKEAILPSYPISQWKQHEKEMRTWPGAVIKRDFGSSGKQVEIFHFDKHSWEAVEKNLIEIAKKSKKLGETWSVQKLAEGSSVFLGKKEFQFDIMTYVVTEPTPTVLFSSRPFTEDKANVAQGAVYGQICRLGTKKG